MNESPLHDAAYAGDTKQVLHLVTAVNVNVRDNNGWTPLHWAAKMGHPETAQVLVNNGADIRVKTSNNATTALHYAASHGHKETAQVLVTNGADVHAKNSGGCTPLDYAKSAAMRQILTPQREGQDHPLSTLSSSSRANINLLAPRPSEVTARAPLTPNMPQSDENHLSDATIAQTQRDDPSIQQPQ